MNEEAHKQDRNRILSAQVVLRSASGRRLSGTENITSANIQEYMPSAETAALATQTFQQAGFETGPVVGNNLAITAPAHTFEHYFQAPQLPDSPIAPSSPTGSGTDAPGTQTKRGAQDWELPLQHLPDALKPHIEAVTFTPPPDFGPTSY